MGVRKPKSLTIEEVDGSPSKKPVHKIIFPNGTVTDNSDGTIVFNPSAAEITMDDFITADNVIVTTNGTSGKKIQQANENIVIPHDTSLTGSLFVSETVTADTVTTTSSRRFKKNIENLVDATQTIEQLQGVSFNWIKNDRKDYGFIAEDVGEILPDAVEWEADGKTARSLGYLKIISFLVEAVKEQNQRINKLEEELRQKSND